MLDKIDINKIIEIAKQAGEAILEVYNSESIEVERKEDSSPLTAADRKANDVIINGLKENYPDIPIISEESKDISYETRKDWIYFWLVDPLDGTKEFIKRNGEFTVNIALINNKEPILGVIYVPVQGVTFYAKKGSGSFKLESQSEKVLRINVNKNITEKITVAGSRSHASEAMEGYLNKIKDKLNCETEIINAGSSLKFCLIAEGKADIYPRLGPTMEWDTGAGQIIVEEAGGVVLDLNKDKMIYNKQVLKNEYFIVSSDLSILA